MRETAQSYDNDCPIRTEHDSYNSSNTDNDGGSGINKEQAATTRNSDGKAENTSSPELGR